MLKTFFLGVIGWFRSLLNKNTDLRYAGKEHIHGVNKSIAELRAQRNVIAGRGIALERQQKELNGKKMRAATAVRNWDNQGDMERRDRAFAEHQAFELQEKDVIDQLTIIAQQVKVLDDDIYKLSSDSNKAEDNLNHAAAQQQLGRAATKVEDVHDLLNSGPLNDVIKASQEQADVAEARRRSRMANGNDDLYDYNTGGTSMADLLGKSSPAPTRTVNDETVRPAIEHREPVSIPQRSTWHDDDHVNHSSSSTSSHTPSHDSHRHDDSGYSSNSDSSSSSFND